MRQTLEHLLNFTSSIWLELPDLNQRKRCCSTKGLRFKERRIEGALLYKTNKQTNEADRCTTSKMIQGGSGYQIITVWSRGTAVSRSVCQRASFAAEAPHPSPILGVLTPTFPTSPGRAWSLAAHQKKQTGWRQTARQERRGGTGQACAFLTAVWTLSGHYYTLPLTLGR